MIHDFLIIRDGLPLLVKNYSSSQKLFSQGDNLIMISGFFSALNSFSDSFEDLGTISELKLSNHDLKLTFLKDSNIPSLIYLATYDEKSKVASIQNFLQKIAVKFIKKFNIKSISNWNGKIDNFNSFDPIINQHVEIENMDNVYNVIQKKTALLEDMSENIVEEKQEINKISEFDTNEAKPQYYKYIPALTTSDRINPKLFLTGESSCEIYDQIDGIKSIDQISQELKLNQDQVYNICKNLIKMGFITFSGF